MFFFSLWNAEWEIMSLSVPDILLNIIYAVY